MAKSPATDSIMALDKMKPLLALSKREPVQAAIGLSAEGEGIILLDKKAKPRRVFAMLKASASKAKLNLNTSSLRFGRAEVDTDYDAGTVRFFINKDAPGAMRMKLTELVKHIAYQKVELNVDPALDLESEEEEDEATATGDAAPGEQTETQPTETRQTEQQGAEQQGAEQQGAEQQGAEQQETEQQGTEQPPAIDIAARRHELAELIQRITAAAAGDKARLAVLSQLAGAANNVLKQEDGAAAAEAIDKLKQAMATPNLSGPAAQPAAATQAPPAAPVSFVAMQKSRLIWDAARKKVRSEIDAFKDAVSRELEGDPDEMAMLDALDTLDEILYNLDDRLLDTLDAALSADDPAKHAALVAEAKGLIEEYLSYALSNEIVRALGVANPLGAILSVGPTVTGTLKALQATLH